MLKLIIIHPYKKTSALFNFFIVKNAWNANHGVFINIMVQSNTTKREKLVMFKAKKKNKDVCKKITIKNKNAKSKRYFSVILCLYHLFEKVRIAPCIKGIIVTRNPISLNVFDKSNVIIPRNA